MLAFEQLFDMQISGQIGGNVDRSVREGIEIDGIGVGQFEGVGLVQLLVIEHKAMLQSILFKYSQNIVFMDASCHHNHNHTNVQPKDKPNRGQGNVQSDKIRFVVDMLLQNFVNPHKILYLLDPRQADKFKARNQKNSSCCSSHKITISDKEMTQNQKWLKEMLTPSFLQQHIDTILSNCAEKHASIVQKGRKDQLEVTDQVQKFVLDKVLPETVNQFVFQQLAEKVKKNGVSVNTQMGLWATPATWMQRYPKTPLNFIPNPCLGQLLGRGWTLVPSFYKSTSNLTNELEMLERDGKYEEKTWIHAQKTKILANPEAYAELEGSKGGYLFENLRQAVLMMSSLPFQLNFKANMFCTVSPNLHICFASSPCHTQSVPGQFRFTVLLNISTKCTIQVSGSSVTLSPGDLFVIDNSKHPHKLSSSESKRSLIILRNFIATVDKK